MKGPTSSLPVALVCVLAVGVWAPRQGQGEPNPLAVLSHPALFARELRIEAQL